MKPSPHTRIVESKQELLRYKRRPAVKQDSIAEELRRQVVEGRLAPGSRLLTRRELQLQFNASLHTVQKALDELIRDGFICARGSLGTFVTNNPPHLCHYGLVFSNYPTDPTFPRGWGALAAEAVTLERQQRIKLPIYYGMDGHSDSEDYQRLVRDVQMHRLAGLIFVSNPFQLEGTPLLDEPNMPRVALMRGQGPIPSIGYNTDMFARRAFDYFVQKARHKIAVLSNQLVSPVYDSIFASYGLANRPYWNLSVALSHASFAKNVIHLLMSEGRRERPNALLITDDNLVEHATMGLLAAGVRVPEDLEVVCHCNFPWPTPSVLPVRRLGFDVREVLNRCISSIDCQRRGERPLMNVMVPAVFEDELSS
jgi:hypothetical protein